MSAIIDKPKPTLKREEKMEYVVQHRGSRGWMDGSAHENSAEARNHHEPGRTRLVVRRTVVLSKVVLT